MVDTVKTAEATDNLDETYDTSDPVQVNNKRKKSSRTKADRLDFIRAAMQHPQGRAWFYDFLDFCSVISTPYRDNPYDTAFKCGMQNVGLRVLGDIQTAAPDQYVSMIKENK